VQGGSTTALKKIYVAANAVDAHMLKGLLEQEGISALVRGDDMVPLQGGSLLRMETRPSVWVFDDHRASRAQELADEFTRRSVADEQSVGSWTCRCGEAIEAQFSECWNCGRRKPAERD